MLALDESGENDVTVEDNGYTFCLEKALPEKTGKITINYGYMGFSVDPEIPLAGAGGCSSCSVGGGCSGS